MRTQSSESSLADTLSTTEQQRSPPPRPSSAQQTSAVRSRVPSHSASQHSSPPSDRRRHSLAELLNSSNVPVTQMAPAAVAPDSSVSELGSIDTTSTVSEERPEAGVALEQAVLLHKELAAPDDDMTRKNGEQLAGPLSSESAGHNGAAEAPPSQSGLARRSSTDSARLDPNSVEATSASNCSDNGPSHAVHADPSDSVPLSGTKRKQSSDSSQALQVKEEAADRELVFDVERRRSDELSGQADEQQPRKRSRVSQEKDHTDATESTGQKRKQVKQEVSTSSTKLTKLKPTEADEEASGDMKDAKENADDDGDGDEEEDDEQEEEEEEDDDGSAVRESDSATTSASESMGDELLLSPAVTAELQGAFDRLWRHKAASLFKRPVKLSEAPDYEELIKQRMDLSLIGERLRKSQFRTMTEFRRDFLLMIANAMCYNSRSSQVYALATELKKVGLMELAKVRDNIREDADGLRGSSRRRRRKTRDS